MQIDDFIQVYVNKKQQVAYIVTGKWNVSVSAQSASVMGLVRKEVLYIYMYIFISPNHGSKHNI